MPRYFDKTSWNGGFIIENRLRSYADYQITNFTLNPLDDFHEIVITCWAGTARIAG